jgi:hypothetical protein
VLSYENQFVLILYKYIRIIQVYVIQHNIEHKIHFVSNVLVNLNYEAKIQKNNKEKKTLLFFKPFVHYQ